MLKCFWLGLPLVQVGKRSIKLETRKATALLAFLSLTPQGCSREALATMFWPDYDQSHALANLRRALSSLTSGLPAGTLEADRETIRWKDPANRWVDVDELHRAVKKVHSHCNCELCKDCLKTLEQAANLYRGDFLESLNLKDSPEFDEWQTSQRQEHQRMLGELLEQLAEDHGHRDRVDEAIGYARRWVALDRLHEPAQRCLLRMLMKAGQRSEAKREYDEFCHLLSEQVGQAPDEETLAIYKQIKGLEVRPQANTWLGQAGSFPLLKTKLFIPTVPARWVKRAQLISLLNRTTELPLTIISAPAGFGKTTLLAEWIAQSAMPIAWLSLDNGDNEPNRFLSYLIAALESIQDGIGLEALRIMRSTPDVATHVVLASLLNDLANLKQPSVLVLDDYQSVTEHAVHGALSYLLNHLPPNLRLVISTRSDPPVQLGRLRAHGQLLELRTGDLRFTTREITEFINVIMQLELSHQDINALENRTEGWVVGLQMAAISLRDRKDVHGFIKGFSGTNRYILDYLLEEVLASQPSDIQQFLIYTSILERFTAPLCDAVLTDGEGFSGQSASILEYLERANLFLVPLDDDCIWYRYHHLFADLLRARLRQTYKMQDIVVLHTRAGQWYEQNGLLYDAIHHASLIANTEWVEHLIEHNYLEIFHRGELANIRFLTDKLSKEMIFRRPWLCIYRSQSQAWFGELDEADVLLAEAEKHICPGQLSPDTQAMLGHIAYVKSRVTAMRGDIHEAIELCLKARDITPANNQALQGGIGVMLSYGYYLAGDFVNAIEALGETIQAGRSARVITTTVAAYCVLARLYSIQGHLHRAYEIYQEAGRFAHEVGSELLGIMAIVEAGMADILYEWNDLEAAKINIEKGLEKISFWNKADDIALAYATHARIQQAQENMVTASESIERCNQLFRTRGVFPEARSVVMTTEVRLWLAQGNGSAVGHWLESVNNNMSSGNLFQYMSELMHITWARVTLSQKKLDETIELLCRLETNALSAGRTGRLIEILILKSLAVQELGQTEQALAILMKSLSLAEPEGYQRIFLNEGQPMQQLLAQCLAHSGTNSLQMYITHLLSQFNSEPRSVL